MNKIVSISVLGLCLLFSSQIKAQEAPSLKINPSGRILMDGGIYSSNIKKFGDGVAVPDIRAGVKASYGSYKAKIDVGYANNALSLKDVFVEKQFSSSSLLRVGYFVHQFGLQSSTSSSMKITMEEPASNEAFFNSRLIGAMFIYDKNDYFATASVHVENEAIKKSTDQIGDQGYGAMSRLAYRPLRNDGAIFQVGISGAYESPRYNSKEELNHNSFVLGARFPSRIAKVKAVEATITEAKHLMKFTPELVAAYGPLGIETQYYYLSVKRNSGFSNYKASGAYGILRGLIKGGNYKYSHGDAGIATPGPGSLEAVLGYNYTDMSDHKAEIRGGRLSDVAVGLNYYINKYMIWRFRYSYTDVRDREGFENQHLNGFQTRFQIIF
jgi:phosphate-selective porin OprO/OprP